MIAQERSISGRERDLRHFQLRQRAAGYHQHQSDMSIQLAPVVLENGDGQPVSLLPEGETSLMILLPADGLLEDPDLAHLIAQRRSVLPPHFQFVVIMDYPCGAVPDALIDREQQIRQLVGEPTAPLLLSVDSKGTVFDAIRERTTIHDWLRNVPRPRSLRVNGTGGVR